MPDGDKPDMKPEEQPAAPAPTAPPPTPTWAPPAWLWRFLPLLITILGVGVVSWSTIQRQGDRLERHRTELDTHEDELEELKDLKATMATRSDIKELRDAIDDLEETMGEQNAILAGIQASLPD